MSQSFRSKQEFEQEVKSRFGVLPNFFCATPDTLEPVQHLWFFAKAAYLENPLPSLFKERLLVHLSRFCPARYCIVRHAGFLLGYGYASGDKNAKAQTIQEVISLLRYPSPSTDNVQSALALLFALPVPFAELPEAGDRNEIALFQAISAIFINPNRSEQPRNALHHAVGGQRSELILSLMSFVRAATMWTLMHPEICIEDDMDKLLAQQDELTTLLLTHEDSERSEIGQRLYSELQTLRREKEQRDESVAAIRLLEERDVEKDKFIAMLGHELRNPMAAITAVSEMFRMVNTTDDRLRNASNILHRQTQALARMLDDLLDVTTLSSGKASINKSPLPVAEVLSNVVLDFEPQLKAKGLTLTLELPNSQTTVQADRSRLAQLFENIFANALQFTNAPGNVAVSAHVDDKQVTVGFTDSGAGFESKFATAIFEPFVQAPQDPRRKPGRLGLGLAIAKKIAELHDGTLQASSPGVGKGGTFTLTLPLWAAQQQTVSNSKSEATPAGARPRVLVVEDNRDFSQLFRDMLQIMGCDTDVASSARSGLDIARESMPDMIFCDIGLPGDMDGFDFARAVRADQELAHIPLVAVSGYTSPEDRQRAVSAGFDRICAKPVKFADISEALAVFSQGKRHGR
jgi:signal transduction histidine kinase/ActR/RegA family two-component response regulator